MASLDVLLSLWERTEVKVWMSTKCISNSEIKFRLKNIPYTSLKNRAKVISIFQNGFRAK
jgi:hypothetical protein